MNPNTALLLPPSLPKTPSPFPPPKPRLTKVLIIDDDAASVADTRRTLERSGRFEIQATCSPLLGLELARQFRPDVVILDIVMPVYDGGDVKLMLAKVPALAKTPVILLSSLVGHDEANSCGFLMCGEDRVMPKPADPVKLPAMIRRLLRNNHHPAPSGQSR